MATKIVTKNSSTAGSAPSASDLVQGELAVNVVDKRLYTEDNAGNIVELGTNPLGEITANGGIALGDNDKATFGASDDLQIYHTGSYSAITDVGTGAFYIGGADFVDIGNSTLSETSARFHVNDRVDLYHNNAIKLTTTATGTTTVGTATMDGLTVDSTTGFSWLPVSTAGTKVGAIGTGTGLIINTPSVNASFGSGLAIDGSYASDLSSVNIKAFGPKFSSYGSELNLFTSDDTSLFKRQTIASNGDISFYEDTGTTAKLFWDASAESLGIGTSSPSYSLDVSTNSVLTSRVQSSAGETILELDNTNTNGRRYMLISGGNSGSLSGGKFGVFDATAGATRLAIDASGNVGIGTSVLTSNSIIRELAVKSTATNGVSRYTLTTTDNGLGASIALSSYLDANALIFGLQTSYDEDGTASPTERMRIDSSGNVGIGTSSPSAKVDLVGGDITGGIKISADKTTSAFFAFGADANETRITSTSYGGYKPLTIHTGGSERMRIDSSGNVLVGTTDSTVFNNTTGSGVVLNSNGQLQVAGESTPLYLNRQGTDGTLANFSKNGTSIGSIGTYGGTCYIGGSGTLGGFMFNGSIEPTRGQIRTDAAHDLGSTAYRFKDIYATNGTIQTSDRNEKQDIAELSDAETAVAVACKGLLRKFRWKDSVAEKGDDARTHFGIIAQDLQAAFEAEGLDAGDYAMFISTTWTDEETNEEKTRMGVRYSELLAFIISAI